MMKNPKVLLFLPLALLGLVVVFFFFMSLARSISPGRMEITNKAIVIHLITYCPSVWSYENFRRLKYDHELRQISISILSVCLFVNVLCSLWFFSLA